MRTFRLNTSGFTLVELIIGMTIFAVGLSGIYALLQTTMRNVSYSRHEIVVANLLREEMELVKNIRDTNVRNYITWDGVQLSDSGPNPPTRFKSGIYIIQNNFDYDKLWLSADNKGFVSQSPVYLKKISLSSTDIATSDKARFDTVRLYFDNQNRYTHAQSASGSQYGSYIIISPVSYQNGATTDTPTDPSGDPQWWIIDARVVVNDAGHYREYDAKTAITDWIK